MAQGKVPRGDDSPGRLQHGRRSVVWYHPVARRLAGSTWEGRGGDPCDVVLKGGSSITVWVRPQRFLRAVERRVPEEDVMAHGWHVPSEA